MRAAYIHAPGPAESVIVGELPEPAAGPAEVLVDLDCTTVNPVDALIRTGTYPVPMQDPFVIGRRRPATFAPDQRPHARRPARPARRDRAR